MKRYKCTTGLLIDFARASFMFDARLCSLTCSNRCGLVILGIENLDQPMRVDGFLGDPRDVAHGVLNPRRCIGGSCDWRFASARQ